MTDEQRQSLRLALTKHYAAGAEVLQIWQSAAARQRVAKVVDREAFGQRLGLLLLGPENAEIMTLQVVLSYGGHVTEIVDAIEYNLATHVLSTHDDNGTIES